MNNSYIKVIGKINKDYTLLLRNHADYVIAYKFDPKTYTWAQGHYFDNLIGLSHYITTLDNQRPSFYRLEEIADQALNYLPWEDLESIFDDLDMTQEEAEYFGLGEEYESYRKDSYKYNE